MADRTIGSLDKLETLDREAKFAVDSGGKSYYGEVGQLEDVATAAAKEYSDSAKKSADAAAESAKDAADVAIHPPILKDGSDHWWTWDTELNDYRDSGVDAGVSLEVYPETITGEPGSAAKVENIGTKTDPILQFTLPQGEKGDKGEVGPEGPEGKQGDTGPEGPRGEAGFSPTVDVKKEGKKTTITITDETGPHAAEILDGEDVVGVSSFNGKTGDIVSNGMNLYEGTRDFTGAKWVGDISPYITNEKYKGLSVFSANTHWINYYQKVEVEAGEYYTVSFYARTDEVNDQSPITVCTFYDGQIDNEIAPLWTGVPITTEWARYARNVKAKNTGVTGFVVANQMNTLPIPRFYVCGIKVEHGNVATDWTPSPNDTTVPVDIWGIPRMHRAIFRGKNLGSVITDEQKAAIAAANWDDLYIGDYWRIDDRNWRIADFDYWYYRGDKYCETHHIVVVPESALYSARMNDTASTDGGYYNSEMRTKNLDQAKEMITSAFGAESILTHRIQLSNASSNGVVTGSIWTDSDVDLMNAAMVFGHRHPASSWAGDEAEQLALFQMANYYTVALWGNYWLRDVYNATDFCTASCYGGISHFNSAMADYHYVRPAVGIIGG